MTGRAAQGVKLINLREDDSIASVARVEIEEVDEIIIEESEIVSDEETNDAEQE
jgi:DNA gyrase subunit A